jgi:zinc protease
MAATVAALGVACQQTPTPSARQNIPPVPTTHTNPLTTPRPASAELPITGSANSSTPTEIAARLLDEPSQRVLRFTNGMTALLQQNKAAPVVSVRMYVKAGSTTEEHFTGAGISHFVEHLVAAANSAKRDQSEYTQMVLQMGNDSNAFTEADHSSYFITTTADKWPAALDLISDITTNSVFTKAQFDREYKVIQRELELNETQPDKIFYAQTLANRYLESPARYPVLGYKAAFQKLTFEDCLAYYHRMYVPDNMILSIAGDIDLDFAETRVLNEIRGLPRKPAPAISAVPEPPVTGPRRSVAHAQIPQARIQWAFPTTDIYGPDAGALDLLARILGSGDSSLLVRQLRDGQSLVTEIRCANTKPRYVAGQLEINASLLPDKAPAAQNTLFAVLDDLLARGITDEALARAKSQVAADFVFDHQTADQQAVHNALDFLIAGDIHFSASYLQRLQALTRDDVQAAARKYLRRDRLLTTLLLPAKSPDPFAPPKSAAGAASDTPIEVRKTVLANGMTILISRNPAAPLACFNLYTLGGLMAEDDSNNGIGAVMMNLLPRETASRSHQQITDFLDATGTALAGLAGNNTFQLSMACVKQRAPEAFSLFADVALHAKFSPQQLNEVRHSILTIADLPGDPRSIEANAVIRGIFYASSPYKRVPEGRQAVIDSLTTTQLQTHYNNYFLNPAHMVLAISGDIDPAVAAQWVAPFASIPAKTPTLNSFTVLADPQRIIKPSEFPSATVMLAYPGVANLQPDRYALILLKTYLGGFTAPSGSLLHETLRGKGLVYSVKTQNISGPAGGMFLITAVGEPQNAQAIADNIASVIASVRQGDLPPADFEAAKQQALTGDKLTRLTVADISAHQALNEALGLGYDEEKRFAEKIQSITREQLLRAARTYLTEPTVVILTPQANAG